MGDCSAARHGTRWAYDKYRCRCPDTVETVRAHWRRHHYYVPGQHPVSKSRDPHVDDVAVERACRGEPVTLTVRERGIAVRRLTSQGLSAADIARRLGISARTVERYRAGQVKHARDACHQTETAMTAAASSAPPFGERSMDANHASAEAVI